LGVGRISLRRGGDRDAGQQKRRLYLAQVGGLMHQIVPRQIVAAHLENLHRHESRDIADNVAGVAGIAFRKPLF
jgi:hypothetical protein